LKLPEKVRFTICRLIATDSNSMPANDKVVLAPNYTLLIILNEYSPIFLTYTPISLKLAPILLKYSPKSLTNCPIFQ